MAARQAWPAASRAVTPVRSTRKTGSRWLARAAGAPARRGQLVSLELPAGAPPQVPVAAIEALNQRGDIPVLTWTVGPTPDGGRQFQRQVRGLARRENQVLLRPLLPARSPGAYRAAWQQLVKGYRAAGDTTLVWVWTPPRPDSLAAYFPGAANLTWMAADCRPARATDAALAGSYRACREQVALQIEMQSKPILLLVPHALAPHAYPWSKQLVERYPEVKGVLFRPQR